MCISISYISSYANKPFLMPEISSLCNYMNDLSDSQPLIDAAVEYHSDHWLNEAV